MSHEIDESTGRAAIAFVGEKPWHGLGAEMQVGMSIADWRAAAGLNWEALSANVQFTNGGLQEWPERRVLYRSDTHAPLSVVTNGYHVVQPKDVMDLYAEIAKVGGFELEVAGALSGGRRIWALAKVNDGAMVVGQDRVRPRILLATSFDGTMATTAKFLAERVVCANTLAIGLAEKSHEVKVNHSMKWGEKSAEQMREKLGVVHNAFEKFMAEARELAARPMNDVEADAFVAMLLEPFAGSKEGKPRDPRETRGYKRIMELFNEKAIGRNMAGATRWGMLNAVTQLIDHERGRTDSTRMESAWFGAGAALKERARVILEGEFKVVEA